MKMRLVVILVSVLLIGTLSGAFELENAKASSGIHIRADGSIDPPIAYISSIDNVTYTFFGNIYEPIAVERDNIVIDGAGYIFNVGGVINGLDLTGRRNVTVEDTRFSWAGNSAVLLQSCTNININENEFNGHVFSVEVYNSSDINIIGNNIVGSVIGVKLYNNTRTTIVANNFTECGISIENSSLNTISGNLVNGKPLVYFENISGITISGAGEVILVNCSNMIVENLNLSGTSVGVQLLKTTNCQIRHNHVSAIDICGINLLSCYNISLVENEIADCNSYGIDIRLSANITILRNNMRNNNLDIYVDTCSNVSLIENRMTSVMASLPIFCQYSSNINIVNNSIANLIAGAGMHFEHSRDATISGNNITGGDGGVTVWESSRFNIIENYMNNTWGAVDFAQSSKSSIVKNNIVGGGYGIDFSASSNNSIIGNVIKGITIRGIGLTSDSTNVPSSYNIIEGNDLINNTRGILISSSSNNSIYHNNFLNNTNQVEITSSKNIWDNGYPSGGNYWSNYAGVDIKSGPFQNETGSDGIGDTPYTINTGNKDNYPLFKRNEGSQDFILSVPYESQGNTGWCAAASTAMILRYYGKNAHVWDVGKNGLDYLTSIINLGQIESYIKTNYPNQFQTSIETSATDPEQIRKDIVGNLSNGYPVLLNVDPPGPQRHDCVVTGYNSTGFFINDPSGTLFHEALGRTAKQFYIQEYASWEELKPWIFTAVRIIDPQVFLVVKANSSPLDASLFMQNGNTGTVVVHDSDIDCGMYVNYGEWCWQNGLFWQPMKLHSITWDSKDTLRLNYAVFNNNKTQKSFDVNCSIRGLDGRVYYEQKASNILVPRYGSYETWTNAITLKDFLVAGQQYTITLKLFKSGSQEVIDSITLPPVFYDVPSSLFMTMCPVRLLITDPDGLRVGFVYNSNTSVNEVPYALYYYGNETEPELVSIPNAKAGNYTVSVFGIESGTYNFTYSNINATGDQNVQGLTNISITKNEVQTIVISDSQTNAPSLIMIPEFAMWKLLPMLIVSTLLLLISSKRKKRMCTGTEREKE